MPAADAEDDGDIGFFPCDLDQDQTAPVTVPVPTVDSVAPTTIPSNSTTVVEEVSPAKHTMELHPDTLSDTPAYHGQPTEAYLTTSIPQVARGCLPHPTPVLKKKSIPDLREFNSLLLG